MSDKRCGLCIHYKVILSSPDLCKLTGKKVYSLDIACADYNKGVSLEGLHNDVAVKKSCAEGEC